MTFNTCNNYVLSKAIKLRKLVTWATDVEIWKWKYRYEAYNRGFEVLPLYVTRWLEVEVTMDEAQGQRKSLSKLSVKAYLRSNDGCSITFFVRWSYRQVKVLTTVAKVANVSLTWRIWWWVFLAKSSLYKEEGLLIVFQTRWNCPWLRMIKMVLALPEKRVACIARHGGGGFGLLGRGLAEEMVRGWLACATTGWGYRCEVSYDGGEVGQGS